MAYRDQEMQEEISDALRWEASLRNDDVAVGVRIGVVTRGGFVDSYGDKAKAERVAGRVRGVTAIANELHVKLPGGAEWSDPDLARAAVDALQWNVAVPHEKIQVKVEQGWITLVGEVEWLHQKQAADRAVQYLRGVKGVFDLISVRPATTPHDVKKRIKDALHRGVEFDADRIKVEIEGNKVVLTGAVRSYTEAMDALRAASNAPGITGIDNHIVVTGALAHA